MLAKLAAHPGVGMLMVRSEEHGAMVFGPNGSRYLAEGHIEGEDPTTIFGPHTLESLRREDAMEHAPDLLLLSVYDPVMGEVAAFEELIGSHGGLGGPQTEPFILHPSGMALDEQVPLGAPAIYGNIRALARRDRHPARQAGSGRCRRADRRRRHGRGGGTRRLTARCPGVRFAFIGAMYAPKLRTGLWVEGGIRAVREVGRPIPGDDRRG